MEEIEIEHNGIAYDVTYNASIENYEYCDGDRDTPSSESGDIVIEIVSVTDENRAVTFDADLWEWLEVKVKDKACFFDLWSKYKP